MNQYVVLVDTGSDWPDVVSKISDEEFIDLLEEAEQTLASAIATLQKLQREEV